MTVFFLENTTTPKKKSKGEKIVSLNYNKFLEDYISIIMAQLYSIKVDSSNKYAEFN